MFTLMFSRCHAGKEKRNSTADIVPEGGGDRNVDLCRLPSRCQDGGESDLKSV